LDRVTDRPSIALIVNGERRDAKAANLAALLAALDYDAASVATALNGEFVPRRKRVETPLHEGDRVEILAPRQGG
jgi:sulfur carrier protein